MVRTCRCQRRYECPFECVPRECEKRRRRKTHKKMKHETKPTQYTLYFHIQFVRFFGPVSGVSIELARCFFHAWPLLVAYLFIKKWSEAAKRNRPTIVEHNKYIISWRFFFCFLFASSWQFSQLFRFVYVCERLWVTTREGRRGVDRVKGKRSAKVQNKLVWIQQQT